MQCPKTPQPNTTHDPASPIYTSDIDPSRRDATRHNFSQRPILGGTPSVYKKVPSEKVVAAGQGCDHVPSTTVPTKNFSKPFKQSYQSDDVFGSHTRSSAAALQFHAAARRLALSPVSQSQQNQSVPGLVRNKHGRRHRETSSATYNAPSLDTPVRPHYPSRRTHVEQDVTSARKDFLYKEPSIQRSSLPSVPPFEPSNYGSPTSFYRREARAPQQKKGQNARNFSRPTPIPKLSPAKARARNFSRPARSIQLSGQSLSKSYTPTKVDSGTYVPLPPTSSHNVDRVDHAPNPQIRRLSFGVSTPEVSESGNHLPCPNVPKGDPERAPEPSCVTQSAHCATRESFESVVSECLGDRRLQLSNSAIWLQRIMFLLFVFAANIGFGLAYLGSFKHPYMLPLLVFMKSKDVISTMVNLLGLLHNFLRQLVWPPERPTSRWILSLVCAYAETEEQILKTVFSLARGSTQPHKQVICVILDGKPRDILSKMSAVISTVQRPYTTWRGHRGEITVNAGHLEGIPLIVVIKAKNAGKKDSLILGHDLFNFPRKSMPRSTQLLRKEIWQTVLPVIVTKQKGYLDKFDFIFCTDADSTIHDQALRRLADALCQENDAIAACGVLFAEFGDKRTEYSPWHLFQQFQYTFGQYVRRQAESMWGRVTCLPGCITMIVVRPETGQAISEYARPVTEHNLFRHQVQYLGTDRRLTWCMMSQGKHLRTVFVPDARSETVVPGGVSHYLSQRRRWASNAYFNDFFYLLGPRQRLITRLFAAIDIVRLSLVYYRVFNTAYFMHGLITHFYIVKIIPTLIVTKTPATWYLLLILIREPFLRKRLHKILLGMCINQVISPILSVIVFTNVLFHMGSQAWGKTGASTQGPSSGTVAAPVLDTSNAPLQGWTPRRLANSVRAAIRGLTPKRRGRTPIQTASVPIPGHALWTSGKHVISDKGHNSPLKSHPLSLSVAGTTPPSSGVGADANTQATASQVACTPMRPRHTSYATPSTLTKRTPYHRRAARSNLNWLEEASTRTTDDSTTTLA